MIGIYLILNTANNKPYIGRSTDIKKRWNQHLYKLRNNIHQNEHLQRAFNKYGQASFQFSILQECSVDHLEEKETYYMMQYNAHEVGYNMMGSSGGTIKASQQLRDKLHDSAMQRQIWKQFPDTKGVNNPHYGKHMSQQTRTKISQARRNKPNINKRKPIIASTGQIFTGASEACIWANVDISTVTKCCKEKCKYAGKHPITGEKLSWKYLNEQEKCNDYPR